MNPFINKTYAECISYLADTYGHSVALSFQGRDYTFNAIKREADKVSVRLAKLGIKPGEKVGIWVPNRPEFAWLWFGAAQMGVVPVILNTRLRKTEFEYQIAQSESVAVFVPGQGAFRDFLGELAESCPSVKSGTLPADPFPKLRHVIALDPADNDYQNVLEWDALGDDGPMPEYILDPDAPGLIAYSSGTTSLPKGAMLTHCIWRKAWDGSRYLDLEPSDCLYLTVPLFGVLGCINGLLMFWSNGSRIVLRDRFDPEDVIKTVRDEKCTLAHMLPTMIERIAEHSTYNKAAFDTLRGGVLLSSKREHFERAAEVMCAEGYTSGYGLTETTGLVTRCRWDAPTEVRLNHQGWPLPDCPIRIIDIETGADLPTGEEGEILIGGYSVMLGYFNKPEETEKTIGTGGWLRSGDLGYLNADGSLKFLRRVKDGYKHKGFNVSTPEVEAAIMRFPDIAAAAVVGVPDPQFGEKGAAFVIPVDGETLDTEKLSEFLKGELASFKVPDVIFVIDAFPLTGGTDKVRKFKLRDLAMEKLGITD
ncbi:class I adenylate-forming enzyme family protein [Sneathiella sp.]|uniref:class I adenylate-forming enzyme family protein n=1 Tax=Sneathiella sp. TaxID=1964365 RepID=UPI0035615A47